MSEGVSFQGSWDGLDSLSLGILFGYLQACSYWRTSLWDWDLHHPEHEPLELLEPDHPPLLFQPPNSAGLSNCGLSSRVAEKSKWWQEAFWGNSSLPHFLSSKKETLKCDITQGTFHLGHRRKAFVVLARHPEWGIFLNFMVDGKWQKWEWPSGAVSVKFRLQGACSTVDSAWVMQKQFRVHGWN